MGWDEDDDDWTPDHDPESLERRREAIAEIAGARRRLLRWVYGILGILLIVVIVLAYTH